LQRSGKAEEKFQDPYDVALIAFPTASISRKRH